ncbi:hypothetical protein TGPRC2_214220 [Toxoplasma gondii TgCatPRC2]|uniref:Uncharacterized protein n=4 Tax=Toxoplasma gondii TaxID=5811 RepID=A0A151HF19_TOXGO|nr:hypothetical protein TGME49_214220 [Toxoplasma gondii ME49]EPT26564.1 hypothetical protein TGME49_214220 [Toxoplasma gondii ME49]KFG35886.1 hypothetical protein TGDOM2_214220 [Toxoplasma gondii GAB2-2007-GAL-DOM2]KYF42962.1 hypothetical protein TGARI_214220 [Toxoplasma gondii ARI]KYK67914.1 hypothetical protein TGPRC2_214220 [Toxoplasma gondii TgCatPRC2]|eukprot:XP_018635748.1 hypothetical protein TGME49_214220 [Toxoplasma gondii ME49]
MAFSRVVPQCPFSPPFANLDSRNFGLSCPSEPLNTKIAPQRRQLLASNASIWRSTFSCLPFKGSTLLHSPRAEKLLPREARQPGSHPRASNRFLQDLSTNMASLLQSLHRLTFWLVGGTDTTPPPVPVPAKFQPLLGEVLVFLNLRGTVPSDWTREQIMSYVDSSVTDKELQAHAIKFLKETGRLRADAKFTTTKTVSTDVGAATGDFESGM